MAAVTQSFNAGAIEHALAEDLSLAGFTPKLLLVNFGYCAQVT